eukprot:2036160-Amphidinium_carterae.1
MGANTDGLSEGSPSTPSSCTSTLTALRHSTQFSIDTFAKGYEYQNVSVPFLQVLGAIVFWL